MNVPNEVTLPELQSPTLNGAETVGTIDAAKQPGSLDLNLQHRAIVRTENLQYTPLSESPDGTSAVSAEPASSESVEAPAEQAPGTNADGSADKTTSSMSAVNVGNRQLRNITEDALEMLRRNNEPPRLFARNSQLVQIMLDEKGRPILRALSVDALRGELSRSANYVENIAAANSKPNYLNRHPPVSVVRDILSRPPFEWGFPNIEAIVEVPCLRPDGSILSDPGYDAATGLYLWPQAGVQFEIPDAPTVGELREARELILEVIADFPFVDEASRHNAVGAILTPICRPAIQGSTPLGTVEAKQPGAGKGLFADNVALIATGRTAALSSAPEDEAEWRKQLTSLLAEGPSLIVFDNVERRLKSAQLCKALTAETWKDRLLSLNKNGEYAVRCSWMATGNNIQLGGDIPRRCYRIQMDAKCAKAFQRTGFRHPDLKAWVRENRARLVRALLVMARAWFVAGCPKPSVQPIGSFESWTRTIGGILEFAGLKSFLANGDELYDEADVESRQWEAFLLALHDRFPHPFRSAEVLVPSATGDLVDDGITLAELLPDSVAGPRETLQHRLGNAFSAHVGRRFGQSGVYLEKAGERQRATLWKVVVPDR
jgi:hypothetical protein